MSHWRILVPVPTLSSTLVVRPAWVVMPAAAAFVGSAAHSAASRSACITRAGPSEIAFLTPTSTVGLPVKRWTSLTGRSWAKITASASAIWAVVSGLDPAEPWVSTRISCPASRAAASRASAAM